MEMDDTRLAIEGLKGKHIKQTLTRLEKIDAASKDVRKIVLDELNDMIREILRTLGYEVED